ncbi:MAG: flagellar brake protein [Burkholderiaceae bacterium]|nr:flagellar brake protein [Burkholderiaceae bacterium]
MGMTTPFPEPQSPELAPFTVHSRVEIIALLKSLTRGGTLTTAYFDKNAGFAVTVLLAVNPEFDEVVFDNPSDAALLRRLLAAAALTIVAFVDNIKLQFAAGAAAPTTFEGKPAFRVRLPEQLLRLQRRDSFRVRTPITRPAHCLVPYGEEGKQYEKLRLLDISVGGVAVLARPEKFELPVGARIDECFLDLPGIGSVGVSLQVRHLANPTRDDQTRSVGCEFVDIAPLARSLIQRYVNKLDAEHRRLAPAA